MTIFSLPMRVTYAIIMVFHYFNIAMMRNEYSKLCGELSKIMKEEQTGLAVLSRHLQQDIQCRLETFHRHQSFYENNFDNNMLGNGMKSSGTGRKGVVELLRSATRKSAKHRTSIFQVAESKRFRQESCENAYAYTKIRC